MLKGDLTKFSPGDLLSFLSHLNQEGVLTVGRNGQGLSISFQNGFLVGADSEQADGKILGALHHDGLISPEQFFSLDQARLETGLPLRQILEDSASIDLAEAGPIFEAGIHEVLFQLFTWETGDFQFNEIPVDPTSGGQVYDCTGLSLEAARQVDEYREFLRNIASEDLSLVLTDSGRQGSECSIEVRHILDSANGEKSVRQVMVDSPFNSFKAMTAVQEALSQSWIELRTGGAPVSVPRVESAAELTPEGKLFLSYKRSLMKILGAQDKRERDWELLSYCKDHFDYFLLIAFKQEKVVRCRRFQLDAEGKRLGTELPNPVGGFESDPTFRFVCESKSPFFGKAFASPLLKGFGEPDSAVECAIIPMGGKDGESFLLFVSTDQEETVPGPLHYLELISWQIHPPRKDEKVPARVESEAEGDGAASEPADKTAVPDQTPTAEALVAGVKELPPMPHVISRVLELLADVNSQASDMVEVLSRDPVLVARLIRVSNSVLYGRGQETTSLGQAVVRLGGKTLRSLVMAASMKTLFPMDQTNVGIWGQSLWQHSIECGLAARRVAQLAGYSDPEEAFVAGVLHDIGKVVILLNKPDEFRLILKRQALEKESFGSAERAILGFDHTDVGELLLNKWQMPGNLRACVKHHHDPAGADSDTQLANIVAAANYLAHAYGSQPDPVLAGNVGDFETICGELNVASDRVQTLLEEIGSYLENSGLLD
ncbi:MAG: HDOD domain-containing protein [Gemmatimonadales bacterium]|nr:HDOD domain-containing protein [Gemmatimonadales bacterium]